MFHMLQSKLAFLQQHGCFLMKHRGLRRDRVVPWVLCFEVTDNRVRLQPPGDLLRRTRPTAIRIVAAGRSNAPRQRPGAPHRPAHSHASLPDASRLAGGA